MRFISDNAKSVTHAEHAYKVTCELESVNSKISLEADRGRVALTEVELGTKLLRSSIIVVIAATLTFHVQRFWTATIDDAFISFRYSLHWAQGLGLTFNVGERVEGYSNFLWVAMMTVARRTGLDVVFAAKVVGLLSLLALAYFALRVLIAAGHAQFAVGAGLGLLLVSNAALVFLAVGGLETIFYAALLMAALERLRAAGNRLTIAPALLLVMVALTRPEGIAYPLVLVPVLWWLHRGKSRRWLALWLVVALIYGGFLLWRRYYFGMFWPNTFYAKTSPITQFGIFGALMSAWMGLPDFAHFIGAAGGPIAVLLAIHTATRPKTREKFLPFTAVILTGLAFQIYAGPDWMNLTRLLVPVWTPFVVLVLIGWQDLSQRLGQPWRTGGLAVWIGFVALLNLSAGSQFWTEREAYPNFVLTSEDMISASQWIGSHYPSHYSIVSWRIGALGYYSGLKVIDDRWGLTDRYIAKLVHANKLTDEARHAYLAERNPELVLERGFSDALPPDEITVGGRQYSFVRRFPQGSEEWWDLYERANIRSRAGNEPDVPP